MFIHFDVIAAILVCVKRTCDKVITIKGSFDLLGQNVCSYYIKL